MGQRLSRAKAKIKLAGIPFRVPERAELGERLETVLDAVYACFSQGWSEVDPLNNALTGEALWLGRLLVQLLPEEPECMGLMALMLFVQSRRNARRGADGAYVRLSEQDVGLWVVDEILEAETLLHQAGKMGRMARYQIEAAIQSVHAARHVTGETDWPSLCLLYQGLYQMTSSVVVKLNWAAALAERDDIETGLAAMPDLAEFPALDQFQPLHAVRADLLARAGRIDEALQAYGRAISLTSDDSVCRFLSQQVDRLRKTLS
jgi:RNA polymerase sigma-70 factor (ECF subfamily)